MNGIHVRYLIISLSSSRSVHYRQRRASGTTGRGQAHRVNVSLDYGSVFILYPFC